MDESSSLSTREQLGMKAENNILISHCVWKCASQCEKPFRGDREGWNDDLGARV